MVPLQLLISTRYTLWSETTRRSTSLMLPSLAMNSKFDHARKGSPFGRRALRYSSASCSHAYSEGVIAVQRSGFIVGRSVGRSVGCRGQRFELGGPRPKSAQYSDREARQIGG